MPPWAALEWERTGWTLLMIPTDTPSSAAARAARWPASPAPITRTSWDGTGADAIAENPDCVVGIRHFVIRHVGSALGGGRGYPSADTSRLWLAVECPATGTPCLPGGPLGVTATGCRGGGRPGPTAQSLVGGWRS